MTTIISWNVNGLRANIFTGPGQQFKPSVKAGKMLPFDISQDSNFARMVDKYAPDIICLQETRCNQDVFEAITHNIAEFPYRYLNDSVNPARGRGSGYSGTAIFSRIKPINITKGLPTLSTLVDDNEGRCITAEFPDVYLVNVYTPNSGSNEEFRTTVWDQAMLCYLKNLRNTGKQVILVGDMNVCREEIDIYSGYPPASQHIAGLLPVEIANMKQYQDNGFVDTYRHMHPDEDEGFTWWNPRIKQHRDLNRGWRLDYGLVSDIKQCVGSDIASEIMGSDHCPIILKIK